MSRREPSRKEKRESKFYFKAEQGEFDADTSLYGSEERNLKKSGFTIVRNEKNKKEAAPSNVSWKDAFKGNIPPLVSDYISGRIKTFPDSAIQNWAQELYVIAARVNFKKTQTNNE
jgi:hypothetical protein